MEYRVKILDVGDADAIIIEYKEKITSPWITVLIDAGNVGDGYTKEMAYDDLFHGIIESIVYPRDKVYSDKSLYNEALEEAERRKSENMKKLYSYQILKS